MQRVFQVGGLVCRDLVKRYLVSGTRISINPSVISSVFHRRSIMSYSIIERGAPNSLEYRVFFKNSSGNLISPFHDVPLYADRENNVFNMIVEVPRWTNAKMEIDTKSRLNPIKQDIKKGKLRFVNNCFPHHGYIWNYGCLPQTWEDPTHKDVHTEQMGDNDPLDVCEIGHKVHKTGDVVQVKVLGIMALIDEGETDWKILAIDVTDPLANELNDIDDIEQHMPGFLRATNEWFRIYKMPTGKPENQFAFDGKAKNREFALDIINQTYEQWEKLIKKSTPNPGVACDNTTLKDESSISEDDALTTVNSFSRPGDPENTELKPDGFRSVYTKSPDLENCIQHGQSCFIPIILLLIQCQEVGPAQEIPADVDKWYYIKL